MPWKIERKHEHVVVVTMNTNKVNAQNPAFFADLHTAFDRLETEFEDCAVVLTGTGKVFSAGLDLDHHFAMFARRNLKEIDDWFAAYRATNLRLFTYPRPTVAAMAMPMRAASSRRLIATIGSLPKVSCSLR